MKSLISCHRGVKESKNEYRHLSILKSLSSHNDNWGFFIPRNKAVTLNKINAVNYDCIYFTLFTILLLLNKTYYLLQKIFISLNNQEAHYSPPEHHHMLNQSHLYTMDPPHPLSFLQMSKVYISYRQYQCLLSFAYS